MMVTAAAMMVTTSAIRILCSIVMLLQLGAVAHAAAGHPRFVAGARPDGPSHRRAWVKPSRAQPGGERPHRSVLLSGWLSGSVGGVVTGEGPRYRSDRGSLEDR